MAWSTPITKSTGDLVTAADWNTNTSDNPTALLPIGIEFFIDEGGGAISTGLKGGIEVPAKCDIDRCTILLDQSATFTADIWKDTYANYPPDNTDTITGGNEPGTSAAAKDQDSTLTDWTTAVAAGVALFFNVDANDNATWALISLKCSRS